MSAEEEPLMARVDPNRDFIKKAIKFLQAHDEVGNEAAREILREFFIQSSMNSFDDMAERIERQLTFRDEFVGDKLQALNDLREVYRFMRRDVYDVFTGQHHPKSRELCDTLSKAENALDVLSAGYVDTPGLRYIQEAIEQEDPDADEVVVLWPDVAEPRYTADDNVISLKKPRR